MRVTSSARASSKAHSEVIFSSWKRRRRGGGPPPASTPAAPHPARAPLRRARPPRGRARSDESRGAALEAKAQGHRRKRLNAEATRAVQGRQVCEQQVKIGRFRCAGNAQQRGAGGVDGAAAAPQKSLCRCTSRRMKNRRLAATQIAESLVSILSSAESRTKSRVRRAVACSLLQQRGERGFEARRCHFASHRVGALHRPKASCKGVGRARVL